MTERPMFHLALPVADLAAAERFYVGVLGARVGRASGAWLDILLWGPQLTLHQQPAASAAVTRMETGDIPGYFGYAGRGRGIGFHVALDFQKFARDRTGEQGREASHEARDRHRRHLLQGA